MIIKTSKCGNCPFVKMDYDDFSVGFDSSASCGLLIHMENSTSNFIVAYNARDEDIPELETILDNCPLKEGSAIVIYEAKT